MRGGQLRVSGELFSETHQPNSGRNVVGSPYQEVGPCGNCPAGHHGRLTYRIETGDWRGAILRNIVGRPFDANVMYLHASFKHLIPLQQFARFLKSSLHISGWSDGQLAAFNGCGRLFMNLRSGRSINERSCCMVTGTGEEILVHR
jgi:hypothetical protein